MDLVYNVSMDKPTKIPFTSSAFYNHSVITPCPVVIAEREHEPQLSHLVVIVATHTTVEGVETQLAYTTHHGTPQRTRELIGLGLLYERGLTLIPGLTSIEVYMASPPEHFRANEKVLISPE